MKLKILSLIIFLVLSTNVSSENNNFPRGHLFIIGGGERPEYMMKKFIELAGGLDKKFIIIPMASSVPIETASEQKIQFQNLGVKNVDYVFCDSTTADIDSNLNKLNGVSGVFFSGGDQSRLTKALLGTKFLDYIKRIYNEGGVVGGTSAGAAIMSEVMITGNELINKDSSLYFYTIQKGNVETKQGFGFLKNAIIDQHFIIRKRLNRLFSVILEHPNILGIGIDEATAIIVKPNGTFDVFGDRTVFVIDPKETNNIEINSDNLFSANDLKIHILRSGQTYDIINRKIINE